MSRRLGSGSLGRSDRRTRSGASAVVGGADGPAAAGTTVLPGVGIRPHPGWATAVSAVLARGALVLVAGLLLWAALPVGLQWSSHVVVTGSMAPAIRPGDVVLTAPVDPVEVRAGQVVSFEDPDEPGRTVVHRVQTVAADGTVVTKGDANPTPDTSRLSGDDVELARIRVPYVGLPLLWLRDGRWPLLALALAVVLALAWLAGRDRHPDDDVTVDLRELDLRDRDDDDRPDDDRPDDGRPGGRAELPSGGRGAHRAPRGLPGHITTAGGVALLVAATTTAGVGHAAFAAASGTGSSSWSMSPYAVFGLNQFQPIVLADSPLFLYRMSGGSGPTVSDASPAARNGTAVGTWTYGVTPQPLPRNTGTAMRSTSTTAFVATPTSTRQVNPQAFSVELWFSTTSSTGGKLVGLENSRTGTSSRYDRHVYLLSGGQLRAGVGPSTNRQVLTSPAAYNDGRWHQVVLTRTSAGIVTLYVDGEVTAVSASALAVDAFNGYWRFGGGRLTSWPGAPAAPTTSAFPGPIANAAAWNRTLTQAEVREHYYAA